eukprot:1117776-Pelagomonas_calceolata.AAC.2
MACKSTKCYPNLTMQKSSPGPQVCKQKPRLGLDLLRQVGLLTSLVAAGVLVKQYLFSGATSRGQPCVQGQWHNRKPLLGLSCVHLFLISHAYTMHVQESLGGNAKTTLLVNVASAQEHADETMQSLSFASRAMCVKNKPVVRVETCMPMST